VIVLNMMRQGRLALAYARFAQARDLQSRAEDGAEADLVDEAERLLFGFHPPCRGAAEMEIETAVRRRRSPQPKSRANRGLPFPSASH